MQASSRTTERTTNTFAFLVTVAAVWGMAHQQPLPPPPPPTPPVEEVAVTLMAPPPEPTPPAPVQEAPPPPVTTAPTVPLLPPKPKKQKPKPPTPPKPVVQQVQQPVPVKQPPAPVQARPVVSSIEPQFIGVLHSYFKSITKYPKDRKARLQKMQGSAKIQFTMNRSGAISDVSVISSAGSPILDQQAISTVTNGNPPPIPANAWPGQAAHVFLVTIEFVSPG